MQRLEFSDIAIAEGETMTTPARLLLATTAALLSVSEDDVRDVDWFSITRWGHECFVDPCLCVSVADLGFDHA